MRIFLTLVILAIIGFGAWIIWGDNDIDVAGESPSPTAFTFFEETSAPFAEETPSPTAIARVSTPRATVRPTATPLGQGGEGPAPVRSPVFVAMYALNGSGQHGVAALTASENDQAVISFNLVGVFQQAYVFTGTCFNLGSIRYALSPLMNGGSMTTLNADFLDLAQSQSSLAIAVYGPPDSTQTQNIYACGQLR